LNASDIVIFRRSFCALLFNAFATSPAMTFFMLGVAIDPVEARLEARFVTFLFL